ncbi:MAG: CDP-alcohol phosphatidyltransferase family protein [Myxococcales bacterium]|nr:CDP-alcohol phosphatidyltransferase family protein [Myxococcales bacterium]
MSETTPKTRKANIAQDLRGIPNLVSLARVLLLFVAITVWFAGFKVAGVALGIVAGLTDYLDGYLARRMNLVTHLGAILDQFSDLLFESTLLLMVMTSGVDGVPPLWLLVIYLVREFWITTIRRFMAAHGLTIHSNFLGKLKTNFIGWSFVPWFLYIADVVPGLATVWQILGWTGVGGGLLWSVLSAVDYSKQFFRAYDTLEITD